jgi:putative nucleotidyltransferase with HDIG domain
MKKLKKIMFLENFSLNIKTINEIVTGIVIILMLLLVRIVNFTVSEAIDSTIKLVIYVAAGVLFISLLAFRIFYVRSINKILETTQRYNALLNATREIRSEKNTDTLCTKVLDHAVSIIGADTGALILENDRGLLSQAFNGNGAEKLYDICNKSGVLNQYRSKGECLRIEDITRDPRFAELNLSRSDLDVSSLLCCFFESKSGMFSGSIMLLHSSPDHFSEDDKEVLEYFSHQAYVALEGSKFITDHENFVQHMTELLLQAMDNHLTIKVEHSRRVAAYSGIIAQAIGLTAEDKKRLHSACLLHDVGFTKFLPSDEDNREMYRRHTTIGHALLSQITFYRREAEIVLHHHERFDGSGYPAMLKGDDIPIESRIIAIAEAFDAITSSDSYKKPLSFTAAMEEMEKNAGTQFDPVLIEAFKRNVGEVL